MRRLRPVLFTALAALCLLGILSGTMRFGASRHTAPLNTLGMMLQEGEGGLTVIAVMEGSPASAGGVLPGDVLLSLSGTPVSDLAGFEAALQSATGTWLRLSLLRGDEMHCLSLRLT